MIIKFYIYKEPDDTRIMWFARVKGQWYRCPGYDCEAKGIWQKIPPHALKYFSDKWIQTANAFNDYNFTKADLVQRSSLKEYKELMGDLGIELFKTLGEKPSDPWIDSYGRSKDDPDFDKYIEEIKRNRDEF